MQTAARAHPILHPLTIQVLADLIAGPVLVDLMVADLIAGPVPVDPMVADLLAEQVQVGLLEVVLPAK